MFTNDKTGREYAVKIEISGFGGQDVETFHVAAPCKSVAKQIAMMDLEDSEAFDLSVMQARVLRVREVK